MVIWQAEVQSRPRHLASAQSHWFGDGQWAWICKYLPVIVSYHTWVLYAFVVLFVYLRFSIVVYL